MPYPAPYILGIGGTLRPFSTSERLLAVALSAIEAEGAVVERISGPQLVMPMFDPSVHERTELAAELVRKVARADGLIFSSPGYHGAISGLIKNALDYVEDLRDSDPVYLDGRAVGCIACGSGYQAAAATLISLRSIVHALRGWPTPLGVVVHSGTIKFDANGRLSDAALQRQLETVGRQVVEFSRMRSLAPAAGREQRMAV
jgi:FMN reductase